MSDFTDFFSAGSAIKNIQRGVTFMTSGASITQAITAVDMSKSTVTIVGHKQNSIDADYTPLGYLSSSTQLTFEKVDSGGLDVYISWEVVEYV